MKYLVRCIFFIYLLLPSALAGQGIEIESGASITISGDATIDVIDGGFINNGTYTKDSETFIFSGNTANTISGSSITDFNNLTNSNSGGISIESSASLTVSNVFSNTGLFIILSDVTGSGSFITSTDGESISMERYLTGNEWHIIGTPATGIDIQTFLQAPENEIPTNAENFAMSSYDETNNSWNPWFTTSTSGNLAVGQGYLLRRTANGAIVFSGLLKATDTDLSIVRSGAGWNLVANPFTSAIRIRGDVQETDNFLGVNYMELDPSYAALYIFDQDSPTQYRILNNSQTGGRYLNQDFIAPGQAFFVRSAVGNGTISFTHSMKSHRNVEVFYKKKASHKGEWYPMELFVSGNGKQASTLVLFNEQMTTGVDVTYDAGLLGGDPDLKIYTRQIDDNGINFAIQCLPDHSFNQLTIPVGIETSEKGTYTFSADIEEVPEEIEIYLVDRKKLLGVNLRENDATITTDIEDYITNDRFFLQFILSDAYTHSDTEWTTTPETVIYCFNKTVFVKGILSEDAFLKITDITGRLVGQYRLEPHVKNVIHPDHLTDGLYIFSTLDGHAIKSTKLYLGN